MTPLLAGNRTELAKARAGLGAPVVLVPTMGALHHGHTVLLQRAAELAGPAGSVVASIFVNPLQFGPNEDFERYPRTLDADLEACGKQGVALVFAPTRRDMYPSSPLVTVDPGPAGQVLEGEFRPGFFGGVLTVVLKLFMLARPDTAVFGEKDAQQLALIRQMAGDLDLGVAIESVPIVRDADGLATSSRNAYLSGPERATALAIPAAMLAGRDAVPGGPTAVLSAARRALGAVGASLSVDYLSLVHPATFQPLGEEHTGPAVLAVAARAGSTRLIDNVPLTFGGEG
ncbi:MAG: pantoate--beta-alanine ligase [Streptosporangiaceae bacterium]